MLRIPSMQAPFLSWSTCCFRGCLRSSPLALIIGAFAERVKMKALVIFTLLWATLVYDPIAHWVWGVGGWAHQLGILDFAGGAVVHVSAGFSALAAVLVSAASLYQTASADAPQQHPHGIVGRCPSLVRMVRL